MNSEQKQEIVKQIQPTIDAINGGTHLISSHIYNSIKSQIEILKAGGMGQETLKEASIAMQTAAGDEMVNFFNNVFRLGIWVTHHYGEFSEEEHKEIVEYIMGQLDPALTLPPGIGKELGQEEL